MIFQLFSRVPTVTYHDHALNNDSPGTLNLFLRSLTTSLPLTCLLLSRNSGKLPLTETVLGRQKSVTVAGVSLNPAIFAISRFFLGQKTGHYSYSVSL